MRPAASLYARIAAWLVLNLAILALAFHFLLWDRLSPEPRVLMAGQAGDRVIAMVRETVDELSQSARGEWRGILDRAGQDHWVKLLLFDSEGSVIAGPQIEIPKRVMKMVAERARIGLASDAARGLLFASDEVGGEGEELEESSFVERVPTLIVNAGGADQWWYGAQLPLSDHNKGRSFSVILLARSEGLSPAFFIAKPGGRLPWVRSFFHFCYGSRWCGS